MVMPSRIALPAMLAAAVLTTAAYAQAPSRTQATPPAADQGREVTHRGCLTTTPSATPSTPAAQQHPVVHLRTGEAGNETTFALVTAPDADIDLARHADRLVEVRGVEYREGTAAGNETSRVQGGQMQDVGQAAIVESPSRARETTADSSVQRTFEVTRIRVIAETCPTP